MLPIKYRDFWDQPRIFLVADGDRLYLFDCVFDNEVEDYPDAYKVYLMPALTAQDLAGSWAGFAGRATHYLGVVPVDEVEFDDSKRQAIHPAVLERFREAAAR